MPPQPPTTFRIEDLKARLKLEPKSRLFYPLAEELRKLDRFADAEKVLRAGLTTHGAYISAWISLGRVLLEQQKHPEAVEILQKACTLDPGNVVAARLLADAYAAVGQPVEAIKKYKLVRALLTSDQEVQDIIARLEVQIHRGAASAATTATSTPVAASEPAAAPPALAPAPAAPSQPAQATAQTSVPESLLAREPEVPMIPATGGDAPVPAIDVDAAMSGKSFTAQGVHVEEIVPPRGEVVGAEIVGAKEERNFPLMRTSEAPFSPPEAPPSPAPGEDMFAHSESTEPPEKPASDPLMTRTMADLYAQQGHQEDAREIYSKLSEPASTPTGKSEPKPAVRKLESWLLKMGRK